MSDDPRRPARDGHPRRAIRDGPRRPARRPSPIPRDYDTRARRRRRDIVELFVERVGDYRATVHRDDGRRAAGGHRRRPRRAAASTRLAVPAGVPDAWLAATERRRASATTRRCRIADLDALDGVITGCAVAIAETGTIVLDGGPDQGRRALSLLPDLHVCVVLAEPGRRAACPRRSPGSTRPAADLDQRAVGDERHRAPAGRGRPRPAPPRGHRRRGLIGRDRVPTPLAVIDLQREARRRDGADDPQAHVARTVHQRQATVGDRQP